MFELHYFGSITLNFEYFYTYSKRNQLKAMTHIYIPFQIQYFWLLIHSSQLLSVAFKRLLYCLEQF